jgi:hypothetical protein
LFDDYLCAKASALAYRPAPVVALMLPPNITNGANLASHYFEANRSLIFTAPISIV